MSKFIEVTTLNIDCKRKPNGLINTSFISPKSCQYINNDNSKIQLYHIDYIIRVKESINTLTDKIEFSNDIEDTSIELTDVHTREKIIINISDIIFIVTDRFYKLYTIVEIINDNKSILYRVKETYEEIVDIIKNLKDTPR